MPYRYARRVQFAETDQAGIVHFSWLFRYMEEAEHALWRAAGLSIAPRDDDGIGWPRVSASFDFKSPLFFEDEFEVCVSLSQVTRRTIQYAFTVVRGETVIGAGAMTSACVEKRPGGSMQAVELPAGLLERLQAAGA